MPEKLEVNSKYYSRSEVIVLLGISAEELRDLVFEGSLEVVTFDGDLLVHRESADRLCREFEVSRSTGSPSPTRVDVGGPEVQRSPRPSPTPPTAKRGESKPVWSCPRCGSEQVVSLSLIYESGTWESEGVALGHSSRGRPTASLTFADGQTKASQRAAPPERQDVSSPVAGAVIMAGLGLLLFVAAEPSTNDGTMVVVLIGTACVIGTVVSSIVASQRNTWNETTHPRLLAAWKRSYRCGRCGFVFELGGEKPSSSRK